MVNKCYKIKDGLELTLRAGANEKGWNQARRKLHFIIGTTGRTP